VHTWNKFDLSLTVLLHYCVRYEQVQFWKMLHCLTYFLVTRRMPLWYELALLILILIFFEMTTISAISTCLFRTVRLHIALGKLSKMLCRKKPHLFRRFSSPNSPYLYPVDYRTITKERVYHTDIHSINELKQQLIQFWYILD